MPLKTIHMCTTDVMTKLTCQITANNIVCFFLFSSPLHVTPRLLLPPSSLPFPPLLLTPPHNFPLHPFPLQVPISAGTGVVESVTDSIAGFSSAQLYVKSRQLLWQILSVSQRYLSVYLSIYLSIYLCVYLCVYLCICRSIYLPICTLSSVQRHAV